MTSKNDVVIVAAKRTAIGAFGGTLKDISAVDLGVHVLKDILASHPNLTEEINEVIIGNVLGAGQGQNIARQVAVKAGLPIETPAFTLNQVCGSGMKALMLGWQSILAGDNQVVIVGGTENMSQAPFLMDQLRWGNKLGTSTVKDSLIVDGLTDAFSQVHMGITAENIADKFDISRQSQDDYAFMSQEKARQAQANGAFDQEIVPIAIPQRKKEDLIFKVDEGVRQNQVREDLDRLKPAFKKDGSVTAGNASTLNDGAALLVIASRQKAEELGLPIMARLVSKAQVGVDPDFMGTGPIPASQMALSKAGLTVEDLDLIEGNEAFAVQALHVCQSLGLDPDKVNVNGGAIALGHPIGCSGARIIVTLLHALEKRQGRYGLATLCIGGGQGDAVIVEMESAR